MVLLAPEPLAAAIRWGEGMLLVGKAADAAELVQCCRLAQADVALVAAPPGGDPGPVLRQLGEEVPAVGRVLLLPTPDFVGLREGMRYGIDEVIVLPREVGELAPAVGRARLTGRQRGGAVTLTGALPPRLGGLITVWSARGGAGKTTISTGLAQSLHNSGTDRVLLVDLDLQFGGVEGQLDLTPGRSLADLLPVAGELDASLLEAVVTRHGAGLHVLCSGGLGRQIDPGCGQAVAAILGACRRCHDVVVADLPSWLTDPALAAIAQATLILYVVTPDVPAVQAMARGLQVLRQQARVDPARLGVVINRAQRRADIQAEEIAAVAGVPVLAQIRADYWKIQGALSAGRPVVERSPARTASVGRDIARLAELVGGLT